MNDISNYTTKQLIEELAKRSQTPGTGLLNSESNKAVMSQLNQNEMTQIGLSLTLGYPDTMSHDKHKCSRCHLKKPNNEFSFYLSRVSADGYLMRSNALCTDCSNKQNSKRSKLLNEAHDMGLIPDKPNSGDTCQGDRSEKTWLIGCGQSSATSTSGVLGATRSWP